MPSAQVHLPFPPSLLHTVHGGPGWEAGRLDWCSWAAMWSELLNVKMERGSVTRLMPSSCQADTVPNAIPRVELREVHTSQCLS